MYSATCHSTFFHSFIALVMQNLFWSQSIMSMTYCYTHTNSVAFSPQANYTDWSTATGRWILVPTFVDRGVSCGQHGRTPTAINLSFLDWSSYFSFFLYAHEAEWTLFQAHCYSENLVSPGIEPGTSVSAARNSDHETAIRSANWNA
jgi:hypothetical protein